MASNGQGSRVPELPEVETVRRGLERQTRGFTIERVEVLRARAIAAPRSPRSSAPPWRDAASING